VSEQWIQAVLEKSVCFALALRFHEWMWRLRHLLFSQVPVAEFTLPVASNPFGGPM
jgi:hypothetical protein